MAINRKLRTDLLNRLKVSPQRLSQRVKKMKTQNGPMSTEDATYVIAHIEGIDISKYLEPNTVTHVRSLIPQSTQKQTVSDRSKKNKSSSKKPLTIKIEPNIPQVDALLSTTLVHDAKKMAQIYPRYYVLENSIRVVIMLVFLKSMAKNGGIIESLYLYSD